MQLFETLTPTLWALLALSALFAGLSKTALPAINTLGVALFAAILPARESTAALLLLLIIGDMFAVASYRKHTNWAVLVRLFPAVAAGIVAGAIFLRFGDDQSVRRVIGIILLALIAITVWRRFHPQPQQPPHAPHAPTEPAARPGDRKQRLARIGYGTLAGFTTMTANAGGPVMSMYFLATKFAVREFLGTAAWFFAIVNLSKVPISFSLGLFNRDVLLLDLCLVPAVVLGALLGRWLVPHINQRVFDWTVIAGTLIGAVYLIK